MKKLLLAISLLVLSTPSWAQGTCPTASIYFNVPIQSFTTLSAAGVTGCYFVSNAGLDTNSGTTEGAAWAHAPGMNGCASNCAITPSPGTGIIFRGGDTWGSTEYFNISFAGTSGAPIYYTVDPTWYSGGSWNRPLLSIAGALPNVNANGESRIIGLTAGWINFDWWEVTGMTCSSTVSQNLMWNNSQYDGLVMTDSYIHGFEAPNTLCAVTTKLPDGQNPAVWLYTQVSGNISNCHGAFEYNVVDGTDGTGTQGAQTVVADPAPCATFAYNVVRNVCSAFGGNLTTVHDNSIGPFEGAIGGFECASSPGLHNHAIRSNEDVGSLSIYNNHLSQVEAEAISVNPDSSGSNTLIYNNVCNDNAVSCIEICDNGAGHCTSGNVSIFNNTIEQVTGGAGYPVQVENDILSLLTNNNHIITSSGTRAASYEFNAGVSATTWPTPLGDLYQTLSTANSFGYNASQPFVYSPTSASSPTVGIGTNMTATGGALDTTYGCSIQTVNGVVESVCPARTPINRPAPLFGGDAGAYMQSLSTGSACGSGTYPNLRCDLTAQPLPATVSPPCAPPASGGCLLGAGYSFYQPEFPTTKICRLTDNSFFAGHGFTTSNDASSEVHDFSILRDFITLGKSGNAQYLFALNAANCTATLASSFTPPGTGSTGTGESGASWFSSTYSAPHILYHGHPCLISTEGADCIANNDLSINQYDVTSCIGSGITTCNPTPSVTVDIASACGVSALNGSVNSGTEWSEGISVDSANQWFFGPGSTTAGQGSSGNVYAVAWYQPTNSCYYWNTATGIQYLNGVSQGTVSTSARFSLHNLRGAPGNGWVRLVPEGGTCTGADCTANGGISEILWQPSTQTVNINAVNLGGGNQCGHAATGYNLWASKCDGSVDVNGLFTHTMATPNTYSSLPLAYPSPEQPNGAHIAWRPNPSDSNPYAAMFEIDSDTFPVTYPWDNENVLVETDNPGAGKVWRCCHNYNSSSIFVPGTISDDGSLLAWTTNYDGLVGCLDGVTQVCLAGPNFTASTFYPFNAIIQPTSGNAGNYLFKVTAQGTAASAPVWTQTSGATVTTGGVTFQNTGVVASSSGSRTDVFLAQLGTQIPPYNFCFQTQGGISAAVAAIYALPNVNCVLIDFGWNQIDTGTAAPSFQWTTYDTANVQAFAPGFTVGSCTTSGGTTSCGVTSATLVAGQHAYIGGNSGCSGDHLLASGTSSTITFASSCVGTGGTVENSCGSNLAQGGQPCKLVVQSQQTFAVGSAKNPAYPFTQSYANSVAPAWTAVTNYGFHSIVTHGGNYYHNTTIGAAGYCTEGATFGSVCAWANDGTTNALPQEVAIGTTFLGDGNGPPSSLWTNGGITFNANSNNCGVGGTTNCGTIGTEPSAFPLYWQTPIQAALINFCTGTDGTNPGMLPHYNSTLGLQLLAIQCGAPQSEEWFFPLYPYLTAQYSMNFTQAAGLYINYAGNTVWSAIHAEYAALGSPSGWGMLVPDGIYAGCSPQSACNTYSDLIASVSLAYAENSPGNVGLRESDPINYATSQPVNGDFVNIFANYPNTKFHFSEPFSLSCPVWSGQAGCAPATQTITGPLNWIFPFLAAHITTGSAASLVVPFGDDIVCAFDASFTVTVSGGAYPPCAFTAYQSPLAAMASGTAAYLLTAAIGGGSGTVTDTTVINCPSSACQAEYFAGGVATLTATPSVGYSFTSWSGGCSGSSASTTVTMSAAKTCTAAFSSTTPQAATPTFSPVAGTYVGTQSVTISTSSAGAIICYNTTGAPQTNGTTGCTVGTLYSGPVAVNSSETLYAVAGGTGYTDSTAGSASYTITSSVTGGFTIFVGSQTVPGTDILP